MNGISHLTTASVLNNLVAQKGYTFLDPQDISDVEKLLLDADRNLRVVPFAELSAIPQEKISLFCVLHGFYQIVTTELVEFIGENIADFSPAIEIGAGNGALGRALDIPLTDNRMQERLDIRLHYKKLGQAVVRYPSDVERKDALAAVRKYRPEAVVAAWVTHKFNGTDGNALGIDEAAMSKLIKRYVFVGNEKVHSTKPLMNLPVAQYKFPWLVSRSMERKQNSIWIWDF